MPLIPYPDQVPERVRKIGRRMIPSTVLTRLVQSLQWAAQYQSLSSPVFRANLTNLAAFHHKYKGQTCVIMGNGPSLTKADFDVLKTVPTFGLNRGYLLWEKHDFTPSFFVAVNDLVIEQFHEDIGPLDCPKFLPWQHNALFTQAEQCLFVPQKWKPGFRADPVKGLWSGGTVTFTAMQLAFYMGFHKVVLVGVDHHFETRGENNAEVVSDGPDPNHFDSRYFDKGTRWNLPDLPLSEKSYLMAAEAFAAESREIINATDGGALEIFPRQPLSAALLETQDETPCPVF